MKRIELKVVIEVPDGEGGWTPGECGEYMIKYLEGNRSPDEWKLISLDAKAIRNTIKQEDGKPLMYT